jgi:hypothetical protein
MSLFALRQHDRPAVAGNRHKAQFIFSAPIHLEAEHIHVVADAGRDTINPQDRNNAFDADPGSTC